MVVHSGSGVLIRGRIEGDNFRIAFTTGGVPFHIDRFGFARDIGHWYRFNRHRDFFHGGYPVYFGYNRGSYYAPVYGQTVMIDPAYVDPLVAPTQSQPMPQVDESTLPALERAHLALEEGRTDDAITYYKAHLAISESDADAMRWLAVALMADGEPASGAAMLIMAYQTDPDLAGSPLIVSRFPDGEDGLRRRFGAAVNFAHSTKGSSAFFAAAVLAQAQDKLDVAKRMLERAKAAGLDRQIVAAFEAVLRR